jgi:SAM-dependent methyltransferase
MAALKSATAQVYLDELIKAGAVRGTTLLEIGCGTGDFLLAAQSAGFHVSGIEISGPAAATANARLGRPCVTTGTLDTVTVPPGSVDTVAFFDVVEHVRQPVDFLSRVHKALKPGGRVILVTPSLDSWSAKLLGSHWMEYKPEHLFYFGERSLGRLFSAAGFGAVLFRPNRKVLSADYVNRHFERFRVPLFSPVMGAVRSVLPATLAHRQFQVVASGVMVLAQKPAEG